MTHGSSCASVSTTYLKPECLEMFITRFYDVADYPEGYIIDVFGIFRLLKYKVSKVMDKEDYIIVMSIFGHEFVLR